jgi:adenylylsulfate kinase
MVLTAFISPLREDRERARRILPPGTFVEIFVDCPLAVCEERDPKGMYAKARQGLIPDFTGVSSPYEAPLSPEITLKSDILPVEACADQVVEYLQKRNLL